MFCFEECLLHVLDFFLFIYFFFFFFLYGTVDLWVGGSGWWRPWKIVMCTRRYLKGLTAHFIYVLRLMSTRLNVKIFPNIKLIKFCCVSLRLFYCRLLRSGIGLTSLGSRSMSFSIFIYLFIVCEKCLQVKSIVQKQIQMRHTKRYLMYLYYVHFSKGLE